MYIEKSFKKTGFIIKRDLTCVEFNINEIHGFGEKKQL